MSFFDDASLAFLPSGGAGKDGKAYSIKPTDGSGDFTFSRGSNLAATRVGPTGLIEKGRENLLLQSNNFSTWNIKNVTSGHAGYDGTNDAWLQSGTGRLQLTISESTGVYTASIYVKAGFSNYVQFRIGGSSTVLVRFELIGNGTTIVDTGTFHTSIEPVSGATGWYRISISFNSDATQFRIQPENDSSGTQTADSSVYIQDAQLEIGLAASEVIESGATTGKAGLLENEPRFDYSGGATCPSLLLEPSRTQLVSYSEYANGFNIVGTGTATDNAETSPEGLQNAFELNDTSSSAYYRIEEFISVSAGNHTMSVFVKKTTGTPTHYPAIQLDSARDYVILNTTTGAYNETGGTDNDSVEIEDWNSDWWRVIITNTLTSGSKRIAIWPALSSNGTSSSPTPTGSNVFYGIQVEQASYPTSYIPNHSGTGSVTRLGDVCNSAGDSSTFNDSEGVLYVEIAALANDGANRRIVISDGTFQNNVQLYYYSFPNRVRTLVNSGGITSIDATAAISDATIYHKIAIRYKTNDFSLWVDGVQVATDTSGNTPSGLNQLNFNDAGGSNFYGKAKQVLYFPTALSDADCITLTT